jgi:hypothetical protein
MINKVCNFVGICKYKMPKDGWPSCTYKSFCDYTAPRDSRLAMTPDGKIGRIEEVCEICAQPLSKCEGHGDGN